MIYEEAWTILIIVMDISWQKDIKTAVLVVKMQNIAKLQKTSLLKVMLTYPV